MSLDNAAMTIYGDSISGNCLKVKFVADRLGVKVLWMQLSVLSPAAEKIDTEAGLTVIMNRCPKIEHGRFSGEMGWLGINRKVIDNRKPLLFGKGGTLKHG